MRGFQFVHPLWMLADFVERLRGTPERLEALLRSIPTAILNRQPGTSWSMLQIAGHLADVEELWAQRLDDLRQGRPTYTPARPEYFQALAQRHLTRSASEVLAEFRALRGEHVAALAAADPELQRRSAFHERLGCPMRLVDCAQFVAEHDDHHLLRIRTLAREFALTAR